MSTAEPIYTRVLRESAFYYTLTMDPATFLAAVESRVPVSMHRQLIKSFLRGNLAPDDKHPYFQYFRILHQRQPALTWSGVVSMRLRTLQSVQDVGIQEPVELFCDRSGFVYYHGHHRLAMALEVGIQIPVTVHACDPVLARLAERLFSIYPNNPYSLYQPVDHPFFDLAPIHEVNTVWAEKCAAILDAAREWRGRVVEAGAHFGMLTRHLRTDGVPCEATDLLPMYAQLQPMFEAIGLEPVPYETTGIQQLAANNVQCRLISMGLWHHLLGKPDLWRMTRMAVLPWMARSVPEAVIEMHHLPYYLGDDPAIALTSHNVVQKFWRPWGFAATPIFEGKLKRWTYHLTRA